MDNKSLFSAARFTRPETGPTALTDYENRLTVRRAMRAARDAIAAVREEETPALARRQAN